ncbi:hypothetical protein B0H63DRAFT_454008 [Podospora didyma]|uniref:T6SS Phospholipase effector Tle1-like catalytic domain-containing protein n=1 Tax=Podospora didyma TaxID=330526 RepID=A0AAE0N791_9PEZI|nr:hypothetical protein B0H63DRAFT_454008 [Podospora didyma]
MPKVTHATNIVLCVDGSFNDQVNEHENLNTNITRIFKLIKGMTKTGRAQPVLYQQGVGTTSFFSSERLATVHKNIDMAFGTATAVENMLATNYHVISSSYSHHQGDKLFMFGFSRGAYVTRLTASLIVDIGTFKYSDLQDESWSKKGMKACCAYIVQSWLDAAGNKTKLDKMLAPFSKALDDRAEVEFLGVFDTVESIGTPNFGGLDLQSKRYKFAEEIADRPKILRGYHALSISEHRAVFKPILWTKNISGRKTSDGRPPQELVQTWFPGFHATVGGGDMDASFTVSILSLVWMMSKCYKLLDIDEKLLAKLVREAIAIKPSGPIEDSYVGALYKFLGTKYRTELGTGVNEFAHVSCDPKTWAALIGIDAMPNMKGTAAEVVRSDKLEIEKPEKFEQDIINEIRESRAAKATRKSSTGAADLPIRSSSNPASFLTGSAHVGPPKGSTVARMDEVLAAKKAVQQGAKVQGSATTSTQSTTTAKTQRPITERSATMGPPAVTKSSSQPPKAAVRRGTIDRGAVSSASERATASKTTQPASGKKAE